MNLINRILVILELVVLIVLSPACIMVLLLSRPSISKFFAPSLALLSAETPNPVQVISVGFLTLLFAFAILLLLLELRKPSVRRLKIQSTQGTEVLMTADAITQKLEYKLDALTNVMRVRPQVTAAGKNGVDVFVEVGTTVDVDIKAKTEEVAGVTRQVVEDELGLKVGKVQIKLDQMKAPAKKK